MDLHPGDIVIANIPDPEGNPCDHRHPAMVLRSEVGVDPIYLVAISTRYDPASRPKDWLLLPFEAGGHPETGLRDACVLKCDWVVRFLASQVVEKIGEIPTNIMGHAIDLILARVEERNTRT